MFGAGAPLLEIAGLAIGVREGVLALIALVALYIAVVLWRMRKLGTAPDRAQALANRDDRAHLELAGVAKVASESTPAEKVPEAMPTETYGGTAAQPADDRLTEELVREVAQLRDEVDVMRGELAALREDMLQEMGHLRAAQTVSPIYGDAVQMAAAGYDAAAIAERCGIARAEAELVVALARSQVE